MDKKFLMKVQKSGDFSSYTATIPMKIVKENGIVKGDVIEVELLNVMEQMYKNKGENV